MRNDSWLFVMLIAMQITIIAWDWRITDSINNLADSFGYTSSNCLMLATVDDPNNED